MDLNLTPRVVTDSSGTFDAAPYELPGERRGHRHQLSAVTLDGDGTRRRVCLTPGELCDFELVDDECDGWDPKHGCPSNAPAHRRWVREHMAPVPLRFSGISEREAQLAAAVAFERAFTRNDASVAAYVAISEAAVEERVSALLAQGRDIDGSRLAAAAHCAHCGDPLPARRSKKRRFCCLNHRMAAHYRRSQGLPESTPTSPSRWPLVLLAQGVGPEVLTGGGRTDRTVDVITVAA